VTARRHRGLPPPTGCGSSQSASGNATLTVAFGAAGFTPFPATTTRRQERHRGLPRADRNCTSSSRATADGHPELRCGGGYKPVRATTTATARSTSRSLPASGDWYVRRSSDLQTFNMQYGGTASPPYPPTTTVTGRGPRRVHAPSASVRAALLERATRARLRRIRLHAREHVRPVAAVATHAHSPAGAGSTLAPPFPLAGHSRSRQRRPRRRADGSAASA